ncbi:protein PTHB1-like [Teleopsis dalmanni]|uniref:protein PTHB1-like n=1 Tax=Teleopsis dalmanni TaxID=139649 RepID=UPI0018CFACAA|nr:protein PTHB1-like [Teleopsis dalmanni]
MSLFNVCNWWTTQCSDLNENYDVASLLCARFGLEESEKDYVVVGSHGGHLSIFYPTLEPDRIEEKNCFKPTDLLLETVLGEPILGIFAGKFSSNIRDENNNQLAVLHLRSVAIYNIQTVGGVAEHGTQLSLQQLTEYKFERGAYSFCKGHFGQVKGREFFCIVHLDGTLTFYEQDGILYECHFPGPRALPTPIAYCESTDCFYRFSAEWNLECYTYQDLAHSSINKSNFQSIWSVCLGEGIIDISVVQAKEEYATIMVLGERNFISLRDNGTLEFILKLDYVPKCFYTFLVGYYWEPNARLKTVIVSDSAKLFIYEDANILWAAQYNNVAPVAIQRSNLHGLPGGIVTLGPSGQLLIGYLGSEPYVFQVPPLEQTEIKFNQAHKDLMQLEDEIKEAVDTRDMEALNQRAYENVRVHFSIDKEIKDDIDDILLDIPADVALKELPACGGALKLKCKIELAELQITFSTPEGIRCTQETITYNDMAAGTNKTIEFDFYIAELLHVHSTRVDVVISFITPKGIPRVIQKTAYLPLSMFFKTRAPQKAAAIKFTFDLKTKLPTPLLATFFPEFTSSESDAQAIGLVLLCPADDKSDEIVTVVAAKNSDRLRIQSDCLETFPMILERLITVTLENEKSKESLEKIKKGKIKGAINRNTHCIVATPFLPSQHILHRIDMHHETEENIRKQTAELDELWLQFKSLQRELQEKSTDEPKETLQMQIEENYDHLIIEGDKLVELRKDEKKQRCDLTCSIATTTLVLSCLCMEEKIVNVVSSVLCTPVEDWTEVSWEESMSPGIDMLHHYGPLTRNKNSNANGVDDKTTAQPSFDYGRFRRHFAIFFDRIVRLASRVDLNRNTSNKSHRDDLAPLLDNNDSTGSSDPMVAQVDKSSTLHRSTLETVQDDGNEYDEEDLREVGYKKDYGSKEEEKSSENTSDWVNENYEIPSNEELFSDLGIWW